jgi:argininosuccinate synthase
MSDIKKAVLAYSGGLDTSVILKWLQDTYQCEVVTFTADLGQGEELDAARPKALQFGIAPENIYIDDLREEFVRDFVFPMFRANTVYEGEYLLGTSIARPLIAKRMIEIANLTGADAVAHGATGKGNDQVRFELGAYALARHQDHRPVAGVGSAVTREAAGLCRAARHSGRNETPAGGLAVFDGRQPAAHQLRRSSSRRPGSRGRGVDVALDGVAGNGAGCPRVR